jgi:excisionase family DNA binding protein
MPEPRITNMDGARTMLGRSRDFIYELVRAGEIESFIDGKSRKFVIASIDAYIRRQVEKATPLGRSPNPAARQRDEETVTA